MRSGGLLIVAIHLLAQQKRFNPYEHRCKIPSADAPREERVARALEGVANTCPFNVTGHPAMTLPCGRSSGLPVGMMLVGRKWNEATVLRAAHAFERISGYVVRPQQASAAGQ